MTVINMHFSILHYVDIYFGEGHLGPSNQNISIISLTRRILTLVKDIKSLKDIKENI